MRKTILWSTVVGLSLAAIGCGSGNDFNNNNSAGFYTTPSPVPVASVIPASPTPVPTPAPPLTAQVLFNPLAGDPTQIPVPNDLLRSQTDGTVSNFPSVAPFNAEPFTSLRTIQGFSTSANVLIPCLFGVDQATAAAPGGIIVVDSKTSAPVNMTVTVLQPFVAGQVTNSTIVLTPVKPLNPATTHLVVITNKVTGFGGALTSSNTTALTKLTSPLVDSSGHSTVPGVDDATAAGMEPIRVAYQPIWNAAEAATQTPRAQIPMAYTFGTQPEFFTLQGLKTVVTATNTGVVGGNVIVNGTTQVAGFYNTTLKLPAVAAVNVGRVVTGAIVMPDYIGNASTGFFVGNGTAAAPVQVKSTRPVPFIAVLPDPTVAPGPRPCVVYQHGLTRSKSDVFAVASGICSAGFGVIAIDLPDHGSLDPNPSPSPTTGSLFINPASPRTFRDNFRQGAVDLMYVAQAVTSGQTTANGTTGPLFAPLPPVYLATDFGAMVVGLQNAVDVNNKVANLNATGGRITNVLLGSQTISPTLTAGLLQSGGLVPNTPNFVTFFLVLQTVLDDGDIINYAPHILKGDLKGNTAGAALIQEYVGNDTLIPNSTTEDLARALGGSQIGPAAKVVAGLSQVTAPFVGSGLFQYTTASTGALLNPAAGPTAAIQKQAITFIATGFQAVANSTVIPSP